MTSFAANDAVLRVDGDHAREQTRRARLARATRQSGCRGITSVAMRPT
jgi:hypothetical protein